MSVVFRLTKEIFKSVAVTNLGTKLLSVDSFSISNAILSLDTAVLYCKERS